MAGTLQCESFVLNALGYAFWQLQQDQLAEPVFAAGPRKRERSFSLRGNKKLNQLQNDPHESVIQQTVYGLFAFFFLCLRLFFHVSFSFGRGGVPVRLA